MNENKQDEPVACIGTNGELMWLNKPNAIYSKAVPLYTHPAQPVQPVGAQDHELALFEAKQLAKGLWNKFYKNDSPNWEVLPDLYGVISQISNMVTGLTRSTAPAVAVNEQMLTALKLAKFFVEELTNAAGKYAGLEGQVVADAYMVSANLNIAIAAAEAAKKGDM